MSTGNIVPGTDKAQVFTGVRKLNNTNQQVISETSSNSSLNNGAFALFTNTNSAGSTVAASYGVWLRGTSNAPTSATGTTAPITNVITNVFDIAAASDANILRVNGTQVATSGASSAGSGNFGTYPLHLGARAGTSVYFDGWMTSYILRFGANLLQSQIEATESWVNQKTGAF
jgi:hypothetical protein